MEHTLSFGRRGILRYWENGPKVELLMEVPNDGSGLYQGWIQGGGERVELGTLLPEQQMLRLRRSLPMDRLRAAGCWPVKEAGLKLIHSFGVAGPPQGWHKEDNPARLFPKDPFLREMVSGLHSCLLWVGKEGFSLAVPFERGRPFSLVPLFCFARIRQLGGRYHAVFPFHHDGRPRREG